MVEKKYKTLGVAHFISKDGLNAHTIKVVERTDLDTWFVYFQCGNRFYSIKHDDVKLFIKTIEEAVKTAAEGSQK